MPNIQICNRVDYAGLGVFIKTSRPTPESVAAGIREVLEDGKYQIRAQQLQRETESFGCLTVVEKELRNLF